MVDRKQIHPRKTKRRLSHFWLVAIIVLIGLILALAIWTRGVMTERQVVNFEDCRRAGGVLMESYPERCMLNGREFVNEDQKVQFDASDYIGMSEQAAISRAESESRVARVIERDGQSLPMTMDLVMGRLNLTIENGQVSRVDVETVD